MDEAARQRIKDVVSDGERKTLYFHLVIAGLGILAIGFLIFGLYGALHLRITSPGLLDRGQLFLILPLGAWWLWLLRRSPVQSFRILSDLKGNAVSVAAGLCNVETRRGVGFVALHKRYVIIGGRRFRAAENIDLDVLVGRSVEARYGAASGVLLSLVQTRGKQPGHNETGDRHRRLDLTAAEKRRLEMIAEGLSDKLIARELDLSPSTIRTYNSSLFTKLGAANRREAVAVARKKGLIGVDQHPVDIERAD